MIFFNLIQYNAQKKNSLLKYFGHFKGSANGPYGSFIIIPNFSITVTGRSCYIVILIPICSLKSSVADPGRYSADPDPADEKKRIRILVKYDYIAHI